MLLFLRSDTWVNTANGTECIACLQPAVTGVLS